MMQTMQTFEEIIFQYLKITSLTGKELGQASV